MPTFAISWAMRIAPYALAAVLCFLIGTYVYNKIYARGMAEVQQKFDAHLRDDAEASAKLNASARAQEQAWNQKFADASMKAMEDQSELEKRYRDQLAGLHSGPIVVRNNRAAVCNNIPTSTVAASSSQSDATPGSTSQLSESDSRVLLQWGAEADYAIRQAINERNQCVAELIIERK